MQHIAAMFILAVREGIHHLDMTDTIKQCDISPHYE